MEKKENKEESHTTERTPCPKCGVNYCPECFKECPDCATPHSALIVN